MSMKLTPVDQIPKMNGYHKLQELIEEFTNGDAKIVKVEFSETDYKSPAVCRSCLAAAIKRSKRPVKVWRRGNEIFLSRDCLLYTSLPDMGERTGAKRRVPADE